MIWLSSADCVCTSRLARRTLRLKMAMGMTHNGSATINTRVSLGCCQNRKANTLIKVMGSRTITDVAPLKMFCSEAVSFITREMSWPVEF